MGKLREFPSYNTTPLSSPSKLHSPIMAANSNVAEFSGDLGFAERATRFSCFGSKSFNGRTSQFPSHRSTPSMADGKLSRVSSSSSLKAFGSNSSLESMISEQISNELNCRKRKANSKGKPKEPIQFDENSNGKWSKVSEEKRCGNGGGQIEEEGDGKSCRNEEKPSKTKSNSKPPEPPKDYIHVRARRGQATDSHSLAKRVKREKISERMKLLQDLVPGCNKISQKKLLFFKNQKVQLIPNILCSSLRPSLEFFRRRKIQSHAISSSVFYAQETWSTSSHRTRQRLRREYHGSERENMKGRGRRSKWGRD